MALIKCSECASDVSDKAKSCPKCGAPVVLPPPVLTRTDTAKMWLMFLGLGAAAVWFIHHELNEAPAPEPTAAVASTAPYEIQALAACSKALKRAAKNPSGINIPYTTDLATAGGYMFNWDKGDGLTMQNGFGAKIDTQATCVVAEDGTTVIGLVVDGKKLIYNLPKHKK